MEDLFGGPVQLKGQSVITSINITLQTKRQLENQAPENVKKIWSADFQ